MFPPLTLGNMQMIEVLIALLPCPIIIPVVIGKQATFILFTKAELESNNRSIVTLPWNFPSPFLIEIFNRWIKLPKWKGKWEEKEEEDAGLLMVPRVTWETRGKEMVVFTVTALG